MRLWAAVRWILLVASLPFAGLGLLSLAVQLDGLVRFDPAFFTQSYIERYTTPEAAARALEKALQAGDQALLAELQGLRRPARLEARSSLALIMLWDRTERYVTYLYLDRQTYQRHVYGFERVKGRWVAAPNGLYFIMRSGRWRDPFWLMALAWWLLSTAGFGLVWLCRNSVRFRAWILGT